MFWFLLFTKWQWKYFTRWFTSLNLKTLEQRQLLKPINCGTFATIKAFYHKIFGLFMRSKTKNWYRRCFNVTQQPLSPESVSALKWCSGQKRWEKKKQLMRLAHEIWTEGTKSEWNGTIFSWMTTMSKCQFVVSCKFSPQNTHTHTNRAHLKRREKSIVKKWHTKEYERKHAHFTNCWFCTIALRMSGYC